MAQANILLLVVTALLSVAEGHKILLIPYNNRSQLIEFHGVGLSLLNRGHQVYIYATKADTPPPEVAAAGYKFIHPSYNGTIMPMWATDDELLESINETMYEQYFKRKEVTRALKRGYVMLSDSIISDESCFEEMRKEKFDYAVVGYAGMSTFLFLIPHKLGIPYSSLSTMHDPFLLRIPHFPSAFPDVWFSTAFGVQIDKLGSSIFDRLKNLLAIFFHEYYMQNWTPEIFAKQNTDFYQVIQKADVHLIDHTYLLTDPMPTIPNAIMVGGLVLRPSVPITDKKIMNYVANSSSPLIVVSFGTIFQNLSPVILNKLLGAFRRLPQYKFLMRLKNVRSEDVPDNLLPLSWLPQNDLLALNQTALFITHSGNNGQHEALFHGVPMVAFYIFGDQKYNAERVERRGYGVKLNLLDFDDNDLVRAIEEVMNNDKYRRKIQTASQIFRQKYAGDIAADAIEHAIKYGGDHLRAHEAYSFSMYEFLMLDIVLVVMSTIAALFILSLFISLKLLKYLFRK